MEDDDKHARLSALIENIDSILNDSMNKGEHDHDAWNHFIFSEHRKEEIQIEKSIASGPKVDKSGVLCKFCKAAKVIVELKQTRSGDEGMTTFSRCTECGKRWKEN
jgi:DNA-directed RNA polymerase subunit M